VWSLHDTQHRIQLPAKMCIYVSNRTTNPQHKLTIMTQYSHKSRHTHCLNAELNTIFKCPHFTSNLRLQIIKVVCVRMYVTFSGITHSPMDRHTLAKFNSRIKQLTQQLIMCYSYKKCQQDALFLKFILLKPLYISDRFTVHHQES